LKEKYLISSHASTAINLRKICEFCWICGIKNTQYLFPADPAELADFAQIEYYSSI